MNTPRNGGASRRTWMITVAAVPGWSFARRPAEAAAGGAFQGRLVLEDVDLENGRNFKLLEPLRYIDPVGAVWEARAGLVVDGASIPRPLWSIVGSPYTGLYRRAAVIHDFYCTYNYRQWERVHRVFYDAMRTAGVGPVQAALMYYAVWRFGPRWDVRAILNCSPSREHRCYVQFVKSATI